MVAVPVHAPASSRDPYGRGRPSSFTPEVQTVLLDCLRRGYKRKLACAKAGIDYSTFCHWQTDANQNESSVYRQFFQEVYAAETAGKAALVDSWLDQTKRDFRAAAKYLAILDPDEYSEQRQLRVLHEGSVTHTHVHVLAPPDLNQVFALLGAPDAIDGESTEAV